MIYMPRVFYIVSSDLFPIEESNPGHWTAQVPLFKLVVVGRTAMIV